MNGLAPRHAPILLIDGRGVFVAVHCKNAFVTKSVEGGMKATDATEQVDESHVWLSAVTVNKL